MLDPFELERWYKLRGFDSLEAFLATVPINPKTKKRLLRDPAKSVHARIEARLSDELKLSRGSLYSDSTASPRVDESRHEALRRIRSALPTEGVGINLWHGPTKLGESHLGFVDQLLKLAHAAAAIAGLGTGDEIQAPSYPGAMNVTERLAATRVMVEARNFLLGVNHPQRENWLPRLWNWAEGLLLTLPFDSAETLFLRARHERNRPGPCDRDRFSRDQLNSEQYRSNMLCFRTAEYLFNAAEESSGGRLHSNYHVAEQLRSFARIATQGREESTARRYLAEAREALSKHDASQMAHQLMVESFAEETFGESKQAAHRLSDAVGMLNHVYFGHEHNLTAWGLLRFFETMGEFEKKSDRDYVIRCLETSPIICTSVIGRCDEWLARLKVDDASIPRRRKPR
jgi:hypothetical protein